MKRLLLGSTALVAASMVTNPAFAQLEVSLGGDFYFGAAWADIDDNVGDSNEFNFGSDTDIEFRFDMVADNGLTFGTRVHLDAESDADVSSDGLIDEAFVFVTGSFGRVEFGMNDSAGDQYGTNFVPSYHGFSLNNNDDTNMDPLDPYDVDTGYFFTSLYNRISTTPEGSDLDTKITYFTPRFAGFQLGVSYSPNPDRNDTGYGHAVDDEFRRNFLEIAAEYDRQVNNVGFALFGSYGQGEAGPSRETPTQFSVGASIDFGGLNFGAAYSEDKMEFSDFFYRPETDQSFVLFAEYETGPLTVYGQYGQNDDGHHEFGYIRRSEDYDSLLIGTTYSLGPGISIGASGQYFQYEERVSGGFSNNYDTDGIVLVTSVAGIF